VTARSFDIRVTVEPGIPPMTILKVDLELKAAEILVIREHYNLTSTDDDRFPTKDQDGGIFNEGWF
jgi:hypothetical protein